MNPDLTHALWFAAYAVMLVVAVWQDATVRRIPNRVVLFGTVAAMVLSVFPGGTGFGNAVAGLVAGLVVLLPFYLLRVMGAGDVKLLAAVGAFVGFPGVFGVVLVTFLAGGLMSLVWAIRTRSLRAVLMNLRTGLSTGMGRVAGGSLPRDGDFPVSAVRVPYAFAIAAGAVAHGLLSNKFGWKNVF